MSEERPTIEIVPTCYRHPNRETWLSCGRCGRPLCPDCAKHGPVGIRCAECLRPGRISIAFGAPEHVGLAFGIGIGEALLWVVVLILSGFFAETFAPNLLLSGLAGGLVGWTIWRISGRTWSIATLRWAVILGACMPIIASVALGLMMPSLMVELELSLGPMPMLILLIRAIVAAAISGFSAWLVVKRRA